MDVEDYVKRIEKDLTEVKTDVKALMIFMAVEKANASRVTKITATIVGGLVSLVVSGVTAIVASVTR